MKSTILKFGVLTLGVFAFSQVNAQSNQRTAEQKFSRIDTNGDNFIDMNELATVQSNKKKANANSMDVSKMFQKVDANNDGKISIDEFKVKQERKNSRNTSDRK